MSGAKRLIAREMGLSTSEIEVLVSILNLISGPGGLISGRLADQLGRRPTSAIACSLTLLGSLAMAASTSFPALLLLGLTRLPESPRFLVAAGREREASAVLDQ